MPRHRSRSGCSSLGPELNRVEHFRHARGVTEHDYSRCERSAASGIAEAQSARQEANLPAHRVLTPPPGVGPGRDQQDNHFSRCLRRLERFAHPRTERTPIWRIAEHAPRPRLHKPIVLLREVAQTLRVCCGRARVEVEPELSVQLVEQALRRRPLVGVGPERRWFLLPLAIRLLATGRRAVQTRSACGAPGERVSTLAARAHRSAPIRMGPNNPESDHDTNVFRYVGTRTTGNGAGNYVIVAADFMARCPLACTASAPSTSTSGSSAARRSTALRTSLPCTRSRTATS